MKPTVRNVLIGIGVLLFLWLVWPTPYAYFGSSPPKRRNRITGKVQVWWGHRWGP
jgi:hypothetical protein